MTITFYLVITFFALGLVIKQLLKWQNFCPLCAATALTWIWLLTSYWRGDNTDPLAVALLAGGSVVGAMYYLAAKLPPVASLFKLPFLLAGWLALYFALGGQADLPRAVLLVLALWLALGLVYLFRRRSSLRVFVQKIIECCRNW
jgi:hypothetical protein